MELLDKYGQGERHHRPVAAATRTRQPWSHWRRTRGVSVVRPDGDGCSQRHGRNAATGAWTAADWALESLGQPGDCRFASSFFRPTGQYDLGYKKPSPNHPFLSSHLSFTWTWTGTKIKALGRKASSCYRLAIAGRKIKHIPHYFTFYLLFSNFLSPNNFQISLKFFLFK